MNEILIIKFKYINGARAGEKITRIFYLFIEFIENLLKLMFETMFVFKTNAF